MSVSTILSIVSHDGGHDVLCAMMDLSNPPRNYRYTRIVFHLNDEEVTRLELGPGMAVNPTLGIHLQVLYPGDTVSVTWYDTGGRSDSAQTVYGK